jgi:acyl CoA:acetate/3-ketoacid CoA transferase alpha subunit
VAEWTTLSKAITRLLHAGDTVALEGFTHLIPFAAGHEIVRQGKRDLGLVRMTPDVIYDQLIGAGCARKLTFSRGGNPGRRLAASSPATPLSMTVRRRSRSPSAATPISPTPMSRARPIFPLP